MNPGPRGQRTEVGSPPTRTGGARTNAVIVSVTIHDFDKAGETLRGQIVPMVSQAPGFVAGYWVTLDGREQGRGTIIMESEEAARALAEQIHGGPAAERDEVTLDSVQVGEVAASA